MGKFNANFCVMCHRLVGINHAFCGEPCKDIYRLWANAHTREDPHEFWKAHMLAQRQRDLMATAFIAATIVLSALWAVVHWLK